MTATPEIPDKELTALFGSVQALALLAKLNLREVLLAVEKTPLSEMAKGHIRGAVDAIDKLREIALTDEEAESLADLMGPTWKAAEMKRIYAKLKSPSRTSERVPREELLK